MHRSLTRMPGLPTVHAGGQPLIQRSTTVRTPSFAAKNTKNPTYIAFVSRASESETPPHCPEDDDVENADYTANPEHMQFVDRSKAMLEGTQLKGRREHAARAKPKYKNHKMSLEP